MLPDAMIAIWYRSGLESQCTYRCVVLPDADIFAPDMSISKVSMHLQVRGAP